MTLRRHQAVEGHVSKNAYMLLPKSPHLLYNNLKSNFWLQLLFLPEAGPPAVLAITLHHSTSLPSLACQDFGKQRERKSREKMAKIDKAPGVNQSSQNVPNRAIFKSLLAIYFDKDKNYCFL